MSVEYIWPNTVFKNACLHRQEDKRVTNQLELAARKLLAMQEVGDRRPRDQDIPMVHLSKNSNGMM